MAHLPAVSFFKVLLALQICAVLMVGSFDSATSIQPPKVPISPLPAPKLPPPIAVEGVVRCKSCKFRGVNTLLGASPLDGAVVKLQCILQRRTYSITGTTDKNGYYFIQPKEIIPFPDHQCKVFLVSSPSKNCTVPTNLNGGLSGAFLEFRTLLPGTKPVALNAVWPLAFEPSAEDKCPL
ncbi:hypothetical protein ACLOJK_008600 [Asimina triloba]